MRKTCFALPSSRISASTRRPSRPIVHVSASCAERTYLASVQIVGCRCTLYLIPFLYFWKL
jgi:hypothetical protein